MGRSNSAHPGGGIGSGAMKKLFNRRTSIAKSDNERMIFFHDIKEVTASIVIFKSVSLILLHTYMCGQVRDDYNTEVMQRSAQKNYFRFAIRATVGVYLRTRNTIYINNSASGVQGISIVMEAGDKQRTLDFEIEEVGICLHYIPLFSAALVIMISTCNSAEALGKYLPRLANIGEFL